MCPSNSRWPSKLFKISQHKNDKNSGRFLDIVLTQTLNVKLYNIVWNHAWQYFFKVWPKRLQNCHFSTWITLEWRWYMLLLRTLGLSLCKAFTCEEQLQPNSVYLIILSIHFLTFKLKLNCSPKKRMTSDILFYFFVCQLAGVLPSQWARKEEHCAYCCMVCMQAVRSNNIFRQI